MAQLVIWIKAVMLGRLQVGCESIWECRHARQAHARHGAGRGRQALVLRERAVPGAPYEGPSAQEIDDEATKTKPEPMPGEAGADNFPQGHFKWNGLDLSIETAKGGVRRDTKPGAPPPWEVEDFPAHYDKIKGAAGEHLDFYLGDHARGRRPRRRCGVEAHPPRR